MDSQENNVIDFTQFKTIQELREYCLSQYNTIETLMSQLKLKDIEIGHLQELLKAIPSLPTITEKKTTNIQIMADENTPSEVITAMYQIELLREKAAHESLQYNEVKALESLSKIVHTYRVYLDTQMKKKPEDTIANLSEDELLSMLKQ